MGLTIICLKIFISIVVVLTSCFISRVHFIHCYYSLYIVSPFFHVSCFVFSCHFQFAFSFRMFMFILHVHIYFHMLFS